MKIYFEHNILLINGEVCNLEGDVCDGGIIRPQCGVNLYYCVFGCKYDCKPYRRLMEVEK